MKKQAYEIDENGYIKEYYVIDENEETDYITMQPPDGLYRAKWTGVEWIEDMTQGEIDALNNPPRELTELELLREQIAQQQEIIDAMLNGGGN